MRGFSITLVAADDAWLPHWFADHGTVLPRPQEFPGIADVAAPTAAAAGKTDPSPWLANLADRLERRRDQFNALDQSAGDGDFGDNLLAGVAKARQRGAADDAVDADIGHLATAYLDEVGGSSGPLLGLVFGGVAGQLTKVDSTELLAGLAEALTAVQRAGGAQRGDRTLVDALAGIVDDAAGRKQGALDEQALRAGIAAADGTRDMVARRGRAAYVGDRALGQPDAGAVAVAWLAVALWAEVTGADSAVLEEAVDALLPRS